MKIDIILKSDLCTSSGENYNAALDLDVVYDEYGFPYIPAKRLKGLIREAALELVEFGIFTQEDYDFLFGLEGIKHTAFILDDAYPEKHTQYVEDLKKCTDPMIKHQQRVLNQYTYTRTQTALTPEGTAKENSLRTFRVVNRGLKFTANLSLVKTLTKTQKKLLKTAVSMVKHIGMNRTRGLGMVEMKLLPKDKNGTSSDENKKEFEIHEQNQILYKIHLKGPVLCKIAEGNQEKTDEYISGDKILGIFAGWMTKEEFSDFMGRGTRKAKELIVSNAYLYKDGKRCLPVPASYQKKKDQEFENGEILLKDLLIGKPDGEQRTPFGSGYISEDGYFGEVETQISYHHKRPENKAIGRASGEDESSFYQLRSLCKDQEFSGYMLADREQAEKIVELQKEHREIRIGNSKYTEYGNAVIEILDVKPIQEQKTAAKEFVLKLNAAVLLYNDYGMPSSDADTLLAYLEEQLGIEKGVLEIRKRFVRYEEIGGFQVTWHRRKQKFTALGKGSVFLISCKKNDSVELPDTLFLGERVSEGYGEAAILLKYPEEVLVRKAGNPVTTLKEEYQTDLVPNLLIVQRNLELKEKARRIADQWIDQFAENQEMTAVLGKLILLKKTVSTFEEMKQQVEGIESKRKRELTNKILSKIEKCTEDIQERFSTESDEIEQEQLRKKAEEVFYEVVLPEYLSQLKYLLKTMNLDKVQKEEGES